VKSYFGHKISQLLIYSFEINFNDISFHDLPSLKSIEILSYERNETQFYIEITRRLPQSLSEISLLINDKTNYEISNTLVNERAKTLKRLKILVTYRNDGNQVFSLICNKLVNLKRLGFK
jgi:hypothetical protein